MTQTSLFQAQQVFNGSDYNHACDGLRLTAQFTRLFELMKDGHWRTLKRIAAATGYPEASISAQLRHMRKARFGSHMVNKRHVGNGLYEYKLIVNEVEQ